MSMDSTVTPDIECPMCREDNIRLTNICPINNPDHEICQHCITNLKQKYNKEFCAYCGERPVIINLPVTVNPHQDTTNIINENIRNRVNTPFDMWLEDNKVFITALLGWICYIGLILNWHLYRMINHYIEEGETLNEEIDWHIYNAFYALIIDTCLAFGIAYMYERELYIQIGWPSGRVTIIGIRHH